MSRPFDPELRSKRNEVIAAVLALAAAEANEAAHPETPPWAAEAADEYLDDALEAWAEQAAQSDE